MKVKVITRSAQEYMRETKNDIHKVQRNIDPRLHPMRVQREYQRALNAVKLDKIFAKPFLFSLSGHVDPVECLMKHPKSLSTLVSGAFDGTIKIWNLMHRQCLKTIQAHEGPVKDMCIPKHGKYFYSVGDNTVIKQWNMIEKVSTSRVQSDDEDDEDFRNQPLNSIVAKNAIIGIDHHKTKPIIATCGETVDLWHESRPSSLKTYKSTIDNIYKIRFNPIEYEIFACTASDRSIILFDTRQDQHIRKVILAMRSNNLAWNPMEAFHFTVANEDHNLYTFDMRKLNEPIQTHLDHVGAVIDLDYSPTGKEFVSGSYDKSLRIFPENRIHSREIYHTKRMQRLTSVIWSLDSKYILCGSDEMDIRVWKARASEKLGPKMLREEMAIQYRDKLKESFAHHPEIKRIARHRHVPKHIYHGKKEKETMINAIKRKEANRRAHSKPGTVPNRSVKEKAVIQEIA